MIFKKVPGLKKTLSRTAAQQKDQDLTGPDPSAKSTTLGLSAAMCLDPILELGPVTSVPMPNQKVIKIYIQRLFDLM